MKILVVGPLNPPDSFADNIQDVFRRLGHDVVTLGAARPLPPVSKVAGLLGLLSDHVEGIDERRQSRLAASVRGADADLLISTDRRLHRTVIDAAKTAGTRTALWFPDHVSNMGRHDMFLAGYDRIYMKNPQAVRRLREIQGLPVAYLPEAANPHRHRSALRYGTEPVVVMAGNIHPTRAVLLERLLAEGIPLRIYSGSIPSWIASQNIRNAYTGQYLTGSIKADAFRSARVVLNNLHPGEFAGVNCRVFEATASGAVVLTEPREGLDQLFDVGREIDTFDTFDELMSRLTHYLQSPANGASVADAAALRAHRDHTYEQRLNRILEDLVS